MQGGRVERLEFKHDLRLRKPGTMKPVWLCSRNDVIGNLAVISRPA